MEIIGALKKSKSPSTVYFCKYDCEEIKWDSVVKLLECCSLKRELDEKSVFCIAVESVDEMATDKRLVGAVFKYKSGYISIAVPQYSDLDIYLADFIPLRKENDK